MDPVECQQSPTGQAWRVTVPNCSALEAMQLVTHLASRGVIDKQHFVWRWTPSHWGAGMINITKPAHVDFDFFDPAQATFFALTIQKSA